MNVITTPSSADLLRLVRWNTTGDTDEDGKVYEVERVVDHRPEERYLVRWKGYGSKDQCVNMDRGPGYITSPIENSMYLPTHAISARA